MKERRRTFYLWLAVAFPVFFLLHWNGLFAETYYWALEKPGGTQRFAPVPAALLSALIIFAAVAALFEIVTRLSRQRD